MDPCRRSKIHTQQWQPFTREPPMTFPRSTLQRVHQILHLLEISRQIEITCYTEAILWQLSNHQNDEVYLHCWCAAQCALLHQGSGRPTLLNLLASLTVTFLNYWNATHIQYQNLQRLTPQTLLSLSSSLSSHLTFPLTLLSASSNFSLSQISWSGSTSMAFLTMIQTFSYSKWHIRFCNW